MTKVRKKQSIGINLDNRCNANCAHCCVSSSPTATDKLDDDEVRRIIDDAIEHPDVVEIGFTGGETLLRKRYALELFKRATDGGLSITCVTNGYWGLTPERAKQMFADLEAVGLSAMTISYDDFHSPYISVESIRNVLEASKDSPIKTILNMAVSRTQDSSALLQELGSSAYCVPVTKYPIPPAGEARNIEDASEFLRVPIEEKHFRCPGYEVIYHNDGRVLPCCSPGVFDSVLSVASTSASIDESINKIERNGVLAIIQREGLGWFRDRLKVRRPDCNAAVLEDVVSACDLCSTIFSDSANLVALKPDIEDYFESLKPATQ